jgi:predicted permease
VKRLRVFLLRLAALLRARQLDRDMNDEIASHLAEATDEYIRQGLSPEDARLAALRSFGGVMQTREIHRDARSFVWVDSLRQDLQYAARMLRRTPGFSAVAVLSFALGIGANAAIFSLINAVMLGTLPVREPDRLVQITRLLDGRPGLVSYPLFEYFRDSVKSISSAFAQWTSTPAIVIDGQDEFVTADLVSGTYNAVLGIEPAAGRLLEPSDDVPSPSSPAAVITDRYWLRHFARSPSAIGKTFTIRDRIFTIVGVMPPSYQSARRGQAPDLMVPLLTMMNDVQRHASDFNSLNLLARLKPGATVEQANAETQVLFGAFVQSQAARASGTDRSAILRQRAAALSAPDGFNPIRDNIAQPLLIAMGIVGLILLLACVNLSGLLLARSAARQREISIRLAIGAGRGRLIRQFSIESLVLAVIGGGIGLALAGWFSGMLFALFVNGRDVVLSVAPDWRVLAFTCAVSLLACSVAGLAPALHAVRINVNPALKEVDAHGHRRLGKALVVAQLAMSMMLIVGATLFVGTFVKLSVVDRGFRSDGLLVLSVRSSRPYAAAREAAVRAALLDRLRALPGVQSASAAQILPVGGALWDRRVQVEGYTFRSAESETVGFNVVAPGYFATLGTPLLAGRDISDRDTSNAQSVAVVNDSFARYFFGDRSPLGRHVTSVGVTYEIVGVVRDAKYQSLRDGIIRTMYIPWMQRQGDQPSSYNYVTRVVRGDAMRLAPGLDSVVREADPALRVRTAVSYDTVIDRTIATERIMAALGGLFGLLAVIVAGVGVFGVLAFQVARRTNELGVRLALGASRRRIMGLVLREVFLMVAIGVSIGAGGALMVTGLARKILFGMTPTDPGMFAIAASVLTVAAGLAGWLPARRASRVDPMVALRHE